MSDQVDTLLRKLQARGMIKNAWLPGMVDQDGMRVITVDAHGVHIYRNDDHGVSARTVLPQDMAPIGLDDELVTFALLLKLREAWDPTGSGLTRVTVEPCGLGWICIVRGRGPAARRWLAKPLWCSMEHTSELAAVVEGLDAVAKQRRV